MAGDPRDDLLEQALQDDTYAGSSAGGDPEGLVETARLIRAVADQTRAEAATAERTARVRFDRYLRQQPGPLAQRASRRWWMRPVGRAGAAVAAAAAVLVLLILVLPMLSGDVDTAAAQVLSPGDVVQVEGVVRDVPEDPAGDITVASELGDLTLRVGDASVVFDVDKPIRRSELRAGDRVVVSGLVRDDRRLDVHAITIGERDQLPPLERRLIRLGRDEEALAGQVIAVSMAGDGETIRIVVAIGERRLLAETAASEAHALLDGGPTLGRDVHIRPGAPGTGRGFEIEAPPGTQPGRGMVSVRGIITAVDGGLLTVGTLDGRIGVRISGSTAIAFDSSGLDAGSFDGGPGAIGHVVVATGRIDVATGDVLADVILLGPAPAIRDRR